MLILLSSSKICGSLALPPITLQPVFGWLKIASEKQGPGLEAVEDPLQPGLILVFFSPGPSPVPVFFWSYGLDFQSLVIYHH